MALVLKVIDARDPTKVIMAYLEPISVKMTLAEFKQKLCNDSDQLREYYYHLF